MALWAGLAIGQTVQGTYGPSYIIQGFYSFENDEMVNVLNTDWDIAFSAAGAQDGGIHVNEAVESSGNELELYEAPTDNFNDVISQSNLGARLYNDESGWNHGAFNANNDPGDPDDYGWGYFNQAENAVIGDRVFVLKLRNGGYRKIQVISLDQGIYTFKYANLDGSGEVTKTINKADSGDIAFFSFAGGGEVVDFIPQHWDLLFIRYSAPLEDGSPEPVNYLVTGVLSGYDVEVAEAKGIDPLAVTFEEYQDSLQSTLDVIGYDWKEFNLQLFQWALDDDLAYFLKTTSGDVWKIIFTSFSGAGSGDFAFEREFVGNVSSSEEQTGAISELGVFPNPLQAETTLAFSLKQAGALRLMLSNTLGQRIWHSRLEGNAGFNAFLLPEFPVPAGQYVLSLELENREAASRLIIKKQ